MSQSLPLRYFLYKEIELTCLARSLCICFLSQFFQKTKSLTENDVSLVSTRTHLSLKNKTTLQGAAGQWFLHTSPAQNTSQKHSVHISTIICLSEKLNSCTIRWPCLSLILLWGYFLFFGTILAWEMELGKATAARIRCACVTVLLFTQRIQNLDFLNAQEGQWQNLAYVCNSKTHFRLASRTDPSSFGAVKPHFSCIIQLSLGSFFQQRHKITHEILLGTQNHKIIPDKSSGLCFSFICLSFLWWCIHKVRVQTAVVSDFWFQKEV